MKAAYVTVLFIFQALILIANAVYDASLCGSASRNASLANQQFEILEIGTLQTNKECAWTITAALGYKVKLTFTSITFTATAGCTGSKLEIFDGNDNKGTKLGEICDLNGVTEFISEGYQMYVVFTAMNLQFFEGFDAPFTQIKGITTNQHDKAICGEEVVNAAVGNSFWSIPIGNAKAHNKQCRWRFYADLGKKVQVIVNEVTFPGVTSCNTNKLQLYQGSNETGTLIATICSMPVNKTFISETNQMFILFTALNVDAGKGFKAEYNQVSSTRGTNVNGPGIIFSLVLLCWNKS